MVGTATRRRSWVPVASRQTATVGPHEARDPGRTSRGDDGVVTRLPSGQAGAYGDLAGKQLARNGNAATRRLP